ncbi:hypothetical protein M413DRAFT_445336 [Hebeloma cylindrosporum]|uniref:Uncharacterized protein n=1 Tax=Hebeloma cylindrosporum TaxID=76867 RepID=A0A0C3CAR6_HEBCY|nr:hypothetical protein M413DRAFT_445336 [Hebeloma cylindrosporum h7]
MISRFIADEVFADPLFRLTKITRPYFLQSRTLVVSCRQLPEPPSGATVQIEDLRKLFKRVEKALYSGTIASRDDQIEKTNEAFRSADAHLRAYIAKYTVILQSSAPDTEEVTGQVIEPWKEVSKKDWIAGSWIKKIKVLAGARLESIKHSAILTLSISLWPEKPRKRENSQWVYALTTLDVKIEKSASLNVLLHKLFWAKAKNKALGRFSLEQNPEFYGKFPDTKDHFRVSNSGSDVHPPINALYVWHPVKNLENGTLHLIIDRGGLDREIELEDLTKFPLPEMYGNGWHLDDDKDLIVVREKGGMHRLFLWNVKQPPVPSLADSSTLTLVDLEILGLAPGLTEEELDKESELVPMPEPVTFPVPEPFIPSPKAPMDIRIPSAPSGVHGDSRNNRPLNQSSITGHGQHLVPATFSSQRSLVEDGSPPPPQSLPKVRPPNTSSLKERQLPASSASPTSSGIVPSLREDMSNQTRESDSSPPSTLIPSPSLGVSPASSQTLATPSSVSTSPKQDLGTVLVKPTSSATNMTNEGPSDTDSASNSEPSSTSQLPPDVPPLPSADQTVSEPEPAPRKRKPFVIKPPETPTSFDPMFASPSTSMQTVGADAPVKKKGMRMWLKDKLEKIVDR